MKIDGMEVPEGAVQFGPPANESWNSETRWWRPVLCKCGYLAREYWNEHGENHAACTKCFNMEIAKTEPWPPDSAVESEADDE